MHSTPTMVVLTEDQAVSCPTVSTRKFSNSFAFCIKYDRRMLCSTAMFNSDESARSAAVLFIQKNMASKQHTQEVAV